MLVLTRRVDESIVIGDHIVVTVLAVEGDRVKLGIQAPREIVVLRHELWQAIHEQNQIAEELSSRPEPPGFEELRKFLSEATEDEEEPGKDPGTGKKKPKGK